MTTISLDYPVKDNGVEVKELSMRRPKVRDQKTARKSTDNDEDYESFLFANLCEVSPDLIDGMDMRDYKKLQKEYKGFLS
ncbi:phage tail assembly protein [Maridesulfovibrio sp.]|uniref:phage tail assembly protein n=1 Tax=Maridesulfovibrio sp. TaxID=2795000 RepID=UPI003B00A14D